MSSGLHPESLGGVTVTGHTGNRGVKKGAIQDPEGPGGSIIVSVIFSNGTVVGFATRQSHVPECYCSRPRPMHGSSMKVKLK